MKYCLNIKKHTRQIVRLFNAKTTLCLYIVILSACSKDSFKKPSIEWLGLWTANESGMVYFLNITEEKGQSFYEVQGSTPNYGNVEISDTQKILRINTLEFNITQYPFMNESLQKKQMQLNHLLYTKN